MPGLLVTPLPINSPVATVRKNWQHRSEPAGRHTPCCPSLSEYLTWCSFAHGNAHWATPPRNSTPTLGISATRRFSSAAAASPTTTTTTGRPQSGQAPTRGARWPRARSRAAVYSLCTLCRRRRRPVPRRSPTPRWGPGPGERARTPGIAAFRSSRGAGSDGNWRRPWRCAGQGAGTATLNRAAGRDRSGEPPQGGGRPEGHWSGQVVGATGRISRSGRRRPLEPRTGARRGTAAASPGRHSSKPWTANLSPLSASTAKPRTPVESQRPPGSRSPGAAGTDGDAIGTAPRRAHGASSAASPARTWAGQLQGSPLAPFLLGTFACWLRPNARGRRAAADSAPARGSSRSCLSPPHSRFSEQRLQTQRFFRSPSPPRALLH